MTQLLDLKQVCEKLAIKRSSLYRWIQDGHFPEPIIIGGKNTRWIESEIEDYINIKKESREADRKKQSIRIMTGFGRPEESV
jgi:prophage regulatory protein